MSKKKKIWIIVVAIIVFTALGTGALALQNAFLNNEESGSSLIPIGIELSSSSIPEENTSSENESNFYIFRFPQSKPKLRFSPHRKHRIKSGAE